MSTPTPITYPNKQKELRARLLGRSASPPKPFKVKSGATYWLKKPTVKQRGIILERAGMKLEDGMSGATPTLMVRVAVFAALLLVVDEEGRPVFEETDLDPLFDSESDSEVGEVISAAQAMMAGGLVEGEESGEAPPDASPTSSQTA